MAIELYFCLSFLENDKVARYKPSEVSGGWRNADEAVDGSRWSCLRRSIDDETIHDHWWMVYLEDVYWVHDVTIFSHGIDGSVAVF